MKKLAEIIKINSANYQVFPKLNKENKILGCNLSDYQRTNILSKITSFEQIERDY